MVATGKTKSTYDIAIKAKQRLSILKANLRALGLGASESSILEALIEDADERLLAKRFRDAAKKTSR